MNMITGRSTRYHLKLLQIYIAELVFVACNASEAVGTGQNLIAAVFLWRRRE